MVGVALMTNINTDGLEQLIQQLVCTFVPAFLSSYCCTLYVHVRCRLGLLFCHFPAEDILRYTVLLHRVRMAGQAGLATSLAVDVETVS